MNALDRILDGDAGLNEAVSRALRRHEGDVADTVDALTDEFRERIDRDAARLVRDDVEATSARARTSDLRTRVSLLERRAEELRREAERAVNDEELTGALTKAREALEYYRIAGMNDSARECIQSIVCLQIKQALAPAVAIVLHQAAREVASLVAEATADLQTFLEIAALAQERLAEMDGSMPAGLAAVDGDWVPDPSVLAWLAQAAIRGELGQPIGGLARQQPNAVLDALVNRLLRAVPPPPGVAKTLSREDIRAFFGLTDPWAGASKTANLLWRIQPPLAEVTLPAGVEVPPGQPAGCTQMRQPGDAHAVVLRVFKFLPLPAIDDWHEWLASDAAVREKFGGVALTSAEPWALAEHDAVLTKFQAAGGRVEDDAGGEAPE